LGATVEHAEAGNQWLLQDKAAQLFPQSLRIFSGTPSRTQDCHDVGRAGQGADRFVDSGQFALQSRVE
jgi:hypothetical protein